MSGKTVLIQIEAGIAILTLNRPEAKNALNGEMRGEMRDAVRRIRDDREVRALVLRGSGSDFCSGGDVRGMNITCAEEGRNRIDDLHGWMSDLIDLDRPVIAAVDGVCYGAGFSFALAADFVIASERSRFCMPFMKVGLVPDCGAFYTLPRVVGLARAKDLVFTAREIGAHEAREIGVVSEIVVPEKLHARAALIAESLAAASPVAFGLAKRALNQSLGADLRAMFEIEAIAQGIAYTTGFHREAVQRFRDRAEPLFRWPAADA